MTKGMEKKVVNTLRLLRQRMDEHEQAIKDLTHVMLTLSYRSTPLYKRAWWKVRAWFDR